MERRSIGASVALNENGAILVVGSPGHNNLNGQIQKFEWVEGDSEYQVVESLGGSLENRALGKAVALCGDGTNTAWADDNRVVVTTGPPFTPSEVPSLLPTSGIDCLRGIK